MMPLSSCESIAKILLVEDNDGDAELVSAILEHHDSIRLRVDRCDRLSDAILKLHDESYELVILDLGLPDSQGLSTLSQIQPAANRVPIVVLTGQEDLELSRQAIRSGAQECLSKSHVSGEFLVRMIGNAVERHKIMSETTTRSLTDELTGLYNRRGLLTISTSFWKAMCRLGTSSMLLYADLDGLKTINDTLGHDQGDEAIKEAADVLRQVFRDSDVLCRLGGDEFVVLAVGSTPEAQDRLHARVQEAVDRRNRHPDRRYRLSLSVGSVWVDSQASGNLDTLLDQADRNMYAVKQSKRVRGRSGASVLIDPLCVADD